MSVHAVISPLIVGYNFLLPSTFQSYLCICKRVLECLLHVFSVKYDGFNLRFQFVQKIAEYEISEFVKTQLTLPDEIDRSRHNGPPCHGNITRGKGATTNNR